LVVALNSDASARRLGKGPDRPLNNELDRAALMAALESVSLVTWFDEDTPLELIAELHPDVLVKGGDYDMSKLAETQVVLAYGGRAQAIPFVDGYSTTALVKKIRQG
jgi:rfaE bifunctional protein nucleotidyltransferase chain/domain